MKTFTCISSLLLAACLASCDNNDLPPDDVIWDFACYSIQLQASDKDGNDLLAPDVLQQIPYDSLYVEYDGKKYYRDTATVETRYAMPMKLALRYGEYKGKYILAFGEFTPCDNYEQEPFTIHWGDGRSDQIAFDCFITWKKGDPTVHQTVYLNGEWYKDDDYLVSFTR